MGPMKTFGYPKRPTKTPGGEEPSMMSELKSDFACFPNPSAFVKIGHFGFPQSSFAPRQARHISAVGLSITILDLQLVLPKISLGTNQDKEDKSCLNERTLSYKDYCTSAVSTPRVPKRSRSN